jgi:lysophospholipase L1-like esterase
MTRLVLLVAALAALALPSAAFAAKRTLYVSVGDSYAAGYQPPGPGRDGGYTGKGYADQLVPLARKAGWRGLKLVNYGCGGETTVSLLKSGGPDCKRGAGPRTGYAGRPQIAAVERYLRRNRARLAFVTVSVGGNDVTSCVRAADTVTCVGEATERIKKNVRTIARRLRKAAGKRVPMVGITYPDVILGGWVSGVKADQDLAGLSAFAFRSLINPALKSAYASSNVRFTDVTAATGAYTPLEQTVEHARYGTIPQAVAQVCDLTWYCEQRDIHANDAGYRKIADLILAKLPKRGKGNGA